MKSNFLLALLCHALAFSACGQIETPLYSGFVIAHDQLWALTGHGHLRLFDLKNMTRLTAPPVEGSVVAIATDIRSALVIGDKHHRIEKYDSGSHSWTLLGNYTGILYGIIFDQANSCYLITSKGVVELGTNRTYFPDSGLNSQIHYHGAWSQISKGAFQPDKIIDGYTFEHPNFIYGFTLHNKVYSASLHQERKYLDFGFWNLIDSAEQENNPAGRFYNIYPSDGLTEIYLTDEQYKFLHSHQLLEFTDPEN